MRTNKLLWLLPLLLLTACGPATNKDGLQHEAAGKSEQSMADTVSVTTATQSTPPVPEQKIIRTADFNCKVHNVFKVVTQLEQTVQALGGAIEKSHIGNTTSDITYIPYKNDSLRQTQKYTTTAELTLRVPVMYLDKVIDTLPKLASFIESRTIQQTNATGQYLANDLRNNAGNTQLAQTIKSAKKPDNALQAQQYVDNREDQKINRRIQNLQIINDVTYATLTVALSQPEQVYVQIVANSEYITHVPFTTKLLNALATGWDGLSELAIVLISAWPLLLLITFAIMLYRWYHHSKYIKITKPGTAMP